MTPEERDEDLMAAVAAGRPAGLERLIRRHATPLLTFIARLVGDRHRAEELFQEVFLAVWTKRRQYDYPRPFRPWLYAIALNRCRADLRLKVHAALPLAEDAAATGDSPADAAEASETARLVSRALLRLPPRQRAVVVLRIWDDLPYARIAEVVGCSEVTVRSHMHHALATLRQALGACLGERITGQP
jgi:RNA polymerase sigma-70 factor (ECF subfamily)